MKVTDYPANIRRKAQQASLHVARHPEASASAYIKHQLLLDQVVAASPTSPDATISSPPVASGAVVPYVRPPTQQQQVLMFPPLGMINPYLTYGYNVGLSLSPDQPANLASQPYPTPNHQTELYVSNLAPAAIIDDDDLAKLFRPFGTVLSASLALSSTGTSLGVGVVKMANAYEAEVARMNVQGLGEHSESAILAEVLILLFDAVMSNRRISVTFSPPLGSPPTLHNHNSMVREFADVLKT